MKKAYILRPWRPEDLESLMIHANDPEIARFMTDRFPYPYTEDKGREFIAQAMQEDPLHILAIEVDGKAAGSIGIHPQTDIMRKNAELGYWLGKSYRGRGIVTAAISEMISYGFGHFDIGRIYARVFGPNKASQRVLEKSGFMLEAHLREIIWKNGELLDELIYGYRKP